MEKNKIIYIKKEDGTKQDFLYRVPSKQSFMDWCVKNYQDLLFKGEEISYENSKSEYSFDRCGELLSLLEQAIDNEKYAHYVLKASSTEMFNSAVKIRDWLKKVIKEGKEYAMISLPHGYCEAYTANSKSLKGVKSSIEFCVN